MDKKTALIESLKIERAGYARRGLVERVAALDEILASLGVRELAAIEPAIETANLAKGKRRKKTEGR
jgi:hypothetical protein